MPSNLLEMSRSVLRRIFSCLLPKPIFTLQFERGCDDNPEVARAVLRKLEDSQRDRGVVCAPPECVKSLLLKFIELVHALEKRASGQLQRRVGDMPLTLSLRRFSSDPPSALTPPSHFPSASSSLSHAAFLVCASAECCPFHDRHTVTSH